MSEKEQFLRTWEREFPTTLKVLNAYPSARMDLKPHAKSKTARDLAWNFVLEEMIIDGAIKGEIDFAQMAATPPATRDEIIRAYEASHRALIEKVRSTPDAELNKTVKWFVGPKQPADVRRMDVLWAALMDMVHHRGQMSVYLRMADGKVPSIYGPTADEPWM
ncbi:MAG: DinB family protein [Acidimicrobiales bacterium]